MGPIALSRTAAIATALALAMPCAWAALYLLPPLNGDVAAILYFADRMLSGDRLYVDLVDVNPPLIFWLNLAPAWLARALGASPATVFVALVLALHAVSLALCRTALRRLDETRGPAARTLVPLALLTALLIVPGECFGQRGHIMMVLALPYLAVTALRLQGDAPSARAAIAAGALAALGFLIKPYFLLIPLVLEGALVARLGPRGALRRPEPLLLVAGGALYAGAAAILCPTYFTEVVPLIERHYLTRSAADALAAVFSDEGRQAALLALMPALALATRRRPALRVAVLVALAGALIAVVQGKGWPYHLLPFWQAVTVAAALLAAEAVQACAGPAPRAAVRLAAVGLFGAVVGAIALEQAPLGDRLRYAESLAGRLERRLAPLAADRPVLWLTDAIYPHYPVVLYDRARPAIAPMGLWMIDSLYGGHHEAPPMRAPAQMSTDERAVFDEVGTALERTHPALVLVASATAELRLPAGSFDYLAYFLRHPSFAREWRHYREVAVIDGTRVFERADTVTAQAFP
jgi:hypothetical protein